MCVCVYSRGVLAGGWPGTHAHALVHVYTHAHTDAHTHARTVQNRENYMERLHDPKPEHQLPRNLSTRNRFGGWPSRGVAPLTGGVRDGLGGGVGVGTMACTMCSRGCARNNGGEQKIRAKRGDAPRRGALASGHISGAEYWVVIEIDVCFRIIIRLSI